MYTSNNGLIKCLASDNHRLSISKEMCILQKNKAIQYVDVYVNVYGTCKVCKQ